MLKRILAIALLNVTWISMAGTAHAASPIALLAQQCLQYEVLLYDEISSDATTQAVALERQLIGLFNLKDSVNYYRQFSVYAEEKELLLQCQLRLADEFAELAHHPSINALVQALQLSQAADEQLLGQRLSQLITQQTSLRQKAALHATQAGLKHALRQQSLSLVIGEENRCLLAKAGETRLQTGNEAQFSESIATYLIAQEDSLCRQQVWQAYQLRAKQKNQQALQFLFDTKQQVAVQHGYPDYASYALASQQLSSPELVNQFLDAITHSAIAPWDLGKALSEAPKTDIKPIFTQVLLQKIYRELGLFGIKVEAINPQVLRVWHRQRLLGEIYFAQNKIPAVKRIRQSVVGHQFGQVSLSFPDVLDDYRAQHQLISALAEALTQLLKGGRYYLLNTLGDNQDTSTVGQYWLSLYLSQKLLPQIQPDSREEYLYAYATQLKVYRSKLALGFYQGRLEAQKYQQEFALSFNQPWPQAQDAIYSFTGIINQGPLYYQELWQQKLAQLIYQHGNDRQDQKQLFSILMINEAQLPFSLQLDTIFGEPMSPSSLIERIQHVQIASIL